MNDVKSRLVRCFAAVFPQVPTESIPIMTLGTTEDWDSMAIATLFALVEEEFGVALDSGGLEDLDSFERVLNFLSHQRLVAEKSLK